ncbi:uncharacterized protein BROUX77_006586 [Berkeleyomyces rouxiae]|uniref:uncharacterized protein n=1 Tax=Berkeleyomyces rouxiae TaxID=2035830 RepID=UPI003B802FB2
MQRPGDKGSDDLAYERDSSLAIQSQQTSMGGVAGASPEEILATEVVEQHMDAESPEIRAKLHEDTKKLQDSLLKTLQRIEAIQSEYTRLDSNNVFLQKYIGELMSTNNITGQKK